MADAALSVGTLLQTWRRRRHFSQLQLASEAGISQRHLSFLESGRSLPSRDMLLHLSAHLAVPMRERNTLLLSAGYAPVFPERPLDDPGMTMAHQAVDRLLKGHEPHPALVVDRRWNLIAANSAVSRLLVGIDPSLLAAPANVLRLSLHPEGLASRIGNFREWRGHIIGRLMRQIENSADPELAVLMEEIRSYPVPANARPHRPGRTDSLANIAVPFELATDFGTLSFLSTTTIFGTALDISLSEMTIESFFPADPLTADSMRRLIAANAE